MRPSLPRALQALAYEEEAQAYLKSLPPEHFMEATPQATQRAITLSSLALVKARRTDMHVFNELLVQYPVRGRRKPGQVVPDNMIVLTEAPIYAESSYNVPLEPAAPFCVFEYDSKSNKRKDYENSFRKYERQLKVPYYLLYYPETQDLTLYRHNGQKYVTVRPDAHGRHAIPQLKLAVGLLNGWVRYWYEGELVPLPAELQKELDEVRRQAAAEARRADDLQRQLEAERQARRAVEQELAELRARLRQR